MEITKNKNATIKKQSSVGCFSMFTLSFSITFIPAFLTNRQELISRGLLVPALFLAEFLILVPLYFIFFRKREGLGRGSFRLDVFFTLFSLIMIIQLFVPYLLAVRKTEEWMISQMSFSGTILWINIFSSVLLVPVYEEIVFRGCLFNSFKFWFNDNIYISAIVTSVIFSALHLQYTDFRTFLML
ncbi:CPBP family intramembrane metalloprotease, partial [Escherichia coli]|nr:CPBP family intramembrane metalloprotease [Escherichia coli]